MWIKVSDSGSQFLVGGIWRFFLLFAFSLLTTGVAAVFVGGIQQSLVEFFPSAETWARLRDVLPHGGILETPICVDIPAFLEGSEEVYSEAGTGKIISGTSTVKKFGKHWIGIHGTYIATSMFGKSQLCFTPFRFTKAPTVTEDPKRVDKSSTVPEFISDAHWTNQDIDDLTIVGPSTSKAKEPAAGNRLKIPILIDAGFDDPSEKKIYMMKNPLDAPLQKFCVNVGNLDPSSKYDSKKLIYPLFFQDDPLKSYRHNVNFPSSVKPPLPRVYYPMIGFRRLKDQGIIDEPWKQAFKSATSWFDGVSPIKEVREILEINADDSSYGNTAPDLPSSSRVAGPATFSNPSSSQSGYFGASSKKDPQLVISTFIKDAALRDIFGFFRSHRNNVIESFANLKEEVDFFNLHYIMTFVPYSVVQYIFDNSDHNIYRILWEVLYSSEFLPYYLHRIPWPSSITARRSEEAEDVHVWRYIAAGCLQRFMSLSAIRCQYDLEPQNLSDVKFSTVYLNRRKAFVDTPDAKLMAVKYMFINSTYENLFTMSWKAWKSLVTDKSIETLANFIRLNISSEMCAAILALFAPFRLRLYLVTYFDGRLMFSKNTPEQSIDNQCDLISCFSAAYPYVSKISCLAEVPDVTLRHLLKELLGDRDLVMIFTYMAGGRSNLPLSVLYKELSMKTLVDAFLVDLAASSVYETYKNPAKEAQIMKLVYEAFGTPFIMDTASVDYFTNIPDTFFSGTDSFFSGTGFNSIKHGFAGRIIGIVARLRALLLSDSDMQDNSFEDVLSQEHFSLKLAEENLKDFGVAATDIEMQILFLLFGTYEFDVLKFMSSVEVRMMYVQQMDKISSLVSFLLGYTDLLALMTKIEEATLDTKAAEDLNLENKLANSKFMSDSPPSKRKKMSSAKEAHIKTVSAFRRRAEYMDTFRRIMLPENVTMPEHRPAHNKADYDILRNTAEAMAQILESETVSENIASCAENIYSEDDLWIALLVLSHPTAELDLKDEASALEAVYDYFHQISNSCFDVTTDGLDYEFDTPDVSESSIDKILGLKPRVEEDVKAVDISDLKNIFFTSNELKELVVPLVKAKAFTAWSNAPALTEPDLMKVRNKLNKHWSIETIFSTMSREDLNFSLKRFVTWYSNHPMSHVSPINWNTLEKLLENYYVDVGFKDFPHPATPTNLHEALEIIEKARNYYYPTMKTDAMMVPQNDGTLKVCSTISNAHPEDYSVFTSLVPLPGENSFFTFNSEVSYQYVVGKILDVQANSCVSTAFTWTFALRPAFHAWVVCPRCDIFGGGYRVYTRFVTANQASICVVSTSSEDEFMNIHPGVEVNYFAIERLKKVEFSLYVDEFIVRKFRTLPGDSDKFISKSCKTDTSLVQSPPNDLYLAVAFEGIDRMFHGASTAAIVKFFNKVINEVKLTVTVGRVIKLHPVIAGEFYSPVKYNALLKISGFKSSEENHIVSSNLGRGWLQAFSKIIWDMTKFPLLRKRLGVTEVILVDVGNALDKMKMRISLEDSNITDVERHQFHYTDNKNSNDIVTLLPKSVRIMRYTAYYMHGFRIDDEDKSKQLMVKGRKF